MSLHAHGSVETSHTAPPKTSPGRGLLRAYVAFLLFVALATTFWFNLIGPAGLAALVLATTMASIGIWAARRPALNLGHMPWFTLAYVAWAGVSVFWSHWVDATGATWVMLVCTTIQGVFIAAVLSWRELVGAFAAALGAIIALSLAFELWVAAVVREPVFPLVRTWEGKATIELAWSRGDLFDLDERIQGIVGNAHLIGMASLLAIIVFSLLIASRQHGRGWLVAGTVVAAVLLWRSKSATVVLAAFAVVLVVVAVGFVRRVRSRRARRIASGAFAVGGTILTLTLFAARDILFDLLGKSDDLTGRLGIWDAVLARVGDHPVMGWGFSTPWVPWEPGFRDWILINGVPLFHAHNAWLDALFQVGLVGVALLALAYAGLVRGSWRLAVGRGTHAEGDEGPFRAAALFPILIVTTLLVQGIAESRPLMEWGWLVTVLLGVKIAQTPRFAAPRVGGPPVAGTTVDPGIGRRRAIP